MSAPPERDDVLEIISLGEALEEEEELDTDRPPRDWTEDPQ